MCNSCNSVIANDDFFYGYNDIIVHIDDCATDDKTNKDYIIYHPINGNLPHKKCIDINDWFEINSTTNNIIRNKHMTKVMYYPECYALYNIDKELLDYVKPGSIFIGYKDFTNNRDNKFIIENVLLLDNTDQMYVVYHYLSDPEVQYSMPIDDAFSTIIESDIESSKYLRLGEEKDEWLLS